MPRTCYETARLASLYDREEAPEWGLWILLESPNRDIAAGFTLTREALGQHYGPAVERAQSLNAHLDAWRDGRGAVKIAEARPGYATLGWLFDQYRRHFQARVGKRAQPGYERALRAIEDMPTKLGLAAALLPLTSITPAATDKFYERLLQGPRKAGRATVAGYCIDIARRAWNVVQRKHPRVVPSGNPWANIERVRKKKAVKPAATREEAYALARALKKMGESHLGAAALICFEWHQRPENVLDGFITWADYASPDHPDHVLIRHEKNDTPVLLPLRDEIGPFYPELEEFLSGLPRLGLPIVLTAARRGPPVPIRKCMLSVACAKQGKEQDWALTSRLTPVGMVG